MRQVDRITPTDREAWHRLRMEDVTASVVGALFGSHKYTTLMQLAAEKCSAKPPDDNSMNAVLRRGRIMEPAVGAALELDHGIKLEGVPHYLRMRDDAEPLLRIGATKDYQTMVDAGQLARIPNFAMPESWAAREGGFPLSLTVEAKSVRWAVFETEWQNGPPLYHYAQAATQAFLGGDDGALIAVLVGEFCDLHVYPVPRSKRFEDELCRRVVDFWRRVEAGEAQPVQAGDPAKSVFPDTVDGAVSDLNGPIGADDDVLAMVDSVVDGADLASSCAASLRESRSTWSDRLALRQALKALGKTSDKSLEVIDEALKMAIGEAESARISGWKVTWKKTTTGARSLRVSREKKKR